MLTGIKHLHSFTRYALLFLLIFTIVNAVMKWLKGENIFDKKDDKLNLITFALAHLQLVVGIALFALSPKIQTAFSMEGGMGEIMGNSLFRFYVVEHPFMMLSAIGLITFGRISMKKMTDNVAKHKRIAITFGIALLLILAGIPWPFRNLGTAWF